MSLVAYDSGSDDSSNEDENDEQQPMQVDGNSNHGAASKGDTQRAQALSSEMKDDTFQTADTALPTSGLKFDSILPKPKYKTNLLLESDPVPPKKVYGDEESMPKPPGPSSLQSSFSKLQKAGGKVRITIPSLKDFENDEMDETDKRKIFQPPKKGSGLFAILPEPKLSSFIPKAQTNAEATPAKNSSTNSTGATASSSVKPPAFLVPQQTLKRPASPTSANKRLAQVRAKYMKQEIDCIKIVSKTDKKPEESTKVKNHHGEDSDEDEEGGLDFFSLDSSAQDNNEVAPMETERVPSPVFFSADRYNKTAGPAEEERLPSASFTSQSMEQHNDDIMKYIQPNAKKAKKGGVVPPVNIIDISADDLRPASTEWIKAISDTSMVPPRKVNLPGGLSKRKHQITYLAAEAKAREEELQNQWAANRHARRQTQSKYGF